MAQPQSLSERRCACQGRSLPRLRYLADLLGIRRTRTSLPAVPMVERHSLGLRRTSGFDGPYQGQFADRLKRFFQSLPLPSDESYGNNWQRQEPLFVSRVSHYAEDEVTYAKAEQLILSLGSAREPIAFELFGIGESRHAGAGPPRIEARFVASKSDIPLLEAQLHANYPRSATVTCSFDEENAEQEWKDRLCGWDCQDPLYVSPLFLAEPYCFPIRTFSKFGPDPLATAVAVMDELNEDEWALVQVLFCRAEHPWAENLRLACEDPYNRGSFLVPGLDRRLLEEKLHAPLYAANVILAANNPRLLAALGTSVHQYEVAHNRLAVRDARAWSSQWNDSEFPSDVLWRPTICSREVLTPGVLLNAAELVGIVHLPSPDVPSERLMRVKSQTRQPPKPVLETPLVVIGQNVHRG